MFLCPDPYLLAVKLEGRDKPHATRNLKQGLHIIRQSRDASLALGAIVTGHIAMVSVMVMTPVHMEHGEVSLRIIGFVISVHILGM